MNTELFRQDAAYAWMLNQFDLQFPSKPEHYQYWITRVTQQISDVQAKINKPRRWKNSKSMTVDKNRLKALQIELQQHQDKIKEVK